MLLFLLALGFNFLSSLATIANSPGFQIKLQFTSNLNKRQQESFAKGVEKWQSVIAGDLPGAAEIPKGLSICNQPPQVNNTLIDDMIVFIGTARIDGTGGIIAQSGPCAFDKNNFIRAGSILMDEADIWNLQNAGSLDNVALHELGHVLGLGSEWASKNLVGNDNSSLVYIGANGAVGQQDIGGTGQPIVENLGGTGTAGEHWKATVYPNELMTGIFGNPSNGNQPLSALTVEALVDLGYQVNVTNADPFVISSISSNTVFNIQVQLSTSVSQSLQDALTKAAARWGEIITEGLPTVATVAQGTSICGQTPLTSDLQVQDLLIFASVADIDGAGGILGEAGPCAFDNAGFPRLGSMIFDTADLTNLEQVGTLDSIVLHEMAHVLGVGSLWDPDNLITPTSSPSPPINYLGTGGIQGQKTIGGTGDPIVEDTGGFGIARVHWKQTVYQNELMTSLLTGSTQPLSALTILSLTDLGYQVDVNKADAFTIPPSSSGRLLLTSTFTTWERFYPASNIVYRVPTIEKSSVQANSNTNTEAGFNGTVVFNLNVVDTSSTNGGAVAGGAIVSLAVAGAAGAFVVYRRRRKKGIFGSIFQQKQLTTQNPMFSATTSPSGFQNNFNNNNEFGGATGFGFNSNGYDGTSNYVGYGEFGKNPTNFGAKSSQPTNPNNNNTSYFNSTGVNNNFRNNIGYPGNNMTDNNMNNGNNITNNIGYISNNMNHNINRNNFGYPNVISSPAYTNMANNNSNGNFGYSGNSGNNSNNSNFGGYPLNYDRVNITNNASNIAGSAYNNNQSNTNTKSTRFNNINLPKIPSLNRKNGIFNIGAASVNLKGAVVGLNPFGMKNIPTIPSQAATSPLQNNNESGYPLNNSNYTRMNGYPQGSVGFGNSFVGGSNFHN